MLSGTTVAGYGNGTSGSDSMGLNGPDEIHLTAQNDLYVVEYYGNRVIRFRNGSRNGTVVAGTGSPGALATQLDSAPSVFVNEVTGGIYVADTTNKRIQLWTNESTVGVTVAGARGDLGSTYGVRLDNNGSIYASDSSNSRVMRWPPNSTTNGTIVAGGTLGSGPWSLKLPRHIEFDPTYSFLYIADKSNHRIQRYNLVNTTETPVTVAGGFGFGTMPNQLNKLSCFCISRKTGALYIADGFNHRVQRWDSGSSAGVTIAGSINGTSGSGATELYYPYGIALDANETFLYVSEFGNHRVQRFPLI